MKERKKLEAEAEKQFKKILLDGGFSLALSTESKAGEKGFPDIVGVYSGLPLLFELKLKNDHHIYPEQELIMRSCVLAFQVDCDPIGLGVFVFTISRVRASGARIETTLKKIQDDCQRIRLQALLEDLNGQKK